MSRRLYELVCANAGIRQPDLIFADQNAQEKFLTDITRKSPPLYPGRRRRDNV